MSLCFESTSDFCPSTRNSPANAALNNPHQDRSMRIHRLNNRLGAALKNGIAARRNPRRCNMSTGGLESMIFHVFVVVFFDGFALMLVVLSTMRALYALGVCQHPQISIDHGRHIPL